MNTKETKKINYLISKKETFCFYLAGVLWISILGGVAVSFYLDTAILSFSMQGIGLVVYYGFLLLLSVAFMIGSIKARAVKVTQKQFPKIFDIVTRQSKQLGMSKVPDVYVLDGDGVLNAFAARFLFRNYVVLFSRVVEAAYLRGDDQALEFIVGHELGHHRAGHTSLRQMLFFLPFVFFFPLFLFLSRAREKTCDRIGYHFAKESSYRAIAMLVVGEKLMKEVDIDEFSKTYAEDNFIITYLLELCSTHPFPGNRLKMLKEYAEKIK